MVKVRTGIFRDSKTYNPRFTTILDFYVNVSRIALVGNQSKHFIVVKILMSPWIATQEFRRTRIRTVISCSSMNSAAIVSVQFVSAWLDFG